MKFIIAILIIVFCVLIFKVYASSLDDDLAVYRLEEFCFRSLNQVNYNLLSQMSIGNGDLGYMTEAKKRNLWKSIERYI